MSLSSVSIQRPVLATVLNLVILIFGFLGITYLGVREFPNVDQPIISVRTSYPGANSDVIENQLTEPLEQSINGIPGIRSLTSVSSQGSSRIMVEFELDVDMETAANDVREKVSKAQRFLPRDVDPPTVEKNDADAQPILMLAISSDQRNMLDLSEIAELTFKEQLQTISGVSAVTIWGQKRYSMRLWLDPVKMAARGVTPMDVRTAIGRENVELPAGKIEGHTMELSIRTLGLMSRPEQFNQLIIKKDSRSVVRFQDIGWAELGPEDEYGGMKLNGIPMVGCAIVPQPGSNHIAIADEVYRRLDLMKKDIPEDVRVVIGFDNTDYVRASVNEVKETIYIAFLLVVLIIFLFLREWRITMIPVLAIPISLIGTFFVMYLMGFSINVLTLLAIVLAVGLVVDDAIVMVENIYVKIESGMHPRQAAMTGSKEIYFAVIATTITLVSVFLPIVFMEGMTGRLFKEFAIVIASAVGISAFVALSFTPMISSLILKRKEKPNLFYRVTEPFFEHLNQGYSRSLNHFLKYWFAPVILFAVAVLSVFLLLKRIPSELAPLEDRSQLSVNVTAQEGATYEYVRDYLEDLQYTIEDAVPEAQAVQSMIFGGSGSLRVVLQTPDERERSQADIAADLAPLLRAKTIARAFVNQQSSLGSRRGGMPVQYVLQAQNLTKLQEVLPRFMDKVQENEVLQMADVNLKFTKPEVQVHINRDKAIQMGVSTEAISQTFQLALSGQRMGYFYMNGKQYQILGKLNRQDRSSPVDLKNLYVKNNVGEMLQIDNFISLEESTAPPNLYRYNRFVSATISANLAPGRTLGEGLLEMDRIAKETLDDTFRTALAGESKEFSESSSSLIFAFGLALVLIFLVLAAQFESFKDPLIIMITVPLALSGALLFMYLWGQTMNVFSQIGLIMLIGLVTKNGILIVEFANQRKDHGMSREQAIREAAALRLRPILMTSFSTVLGILPLCFATGEGSAGRMAMGLAVVGGVTVGTLLTLYVIPAVYLFISTKTEYIRARHIKSLKSEGGVQ